MFALVKEYSWNKPFITLDFKRWLIEHKDRKFYVEKDFGNSVRLSKINFLITKDFLNISDN